MPGRWHNDLMDLDTARYVSLTTFRSDGTPKATPVWITGSGGTYRFTTGADSWKVRRLRNDPRVQVRVSDMRGRVEPHTTVHHGTGEILADTASLEETSAAVMEKYGFMARLISLSHKVTQLLGRGDDDSVAIQLVIDEAS